MRRAVVAIDTIHAPFFRGCDLFRTQPSSSIVIFSNIAISILHANPGNHLPLLIARDERDLIAEIHVPVNSSHWSTPGIAATHVDKHLHLTQRVLFVVSVVIERLELGAMKLRRPVTLFAGLIGWTHVVNRRLDWS